MSKLTKELVKNINSNKSFSLDTFATKLSANQLEKILRELSDAYYNKGESLLSDEIFDYLKDTLEKKDSNNSFLQEIGAPVTIGEEVKLPYPMGSLDKIKPNTSELDKWKASYKGPYIISDKLDGFSCQLYIDSKGEPHLYTRGDSEHGYDISHLVKYLVNHEKIKKIKKLELPISIRGELIISRENFKKVNTKYKNSRNALTSYVKSKRINKTLADIVDFVGYTVIMPNLTQEDQMKYLETFKPLNHIVEYKKYNYNKLTNDNLSKYLEDRRKNSDYDIDGIVVYDSSRKYEHSGGNPEYGFAFKAILSDQYAEALVTDVLWEPSMDGFLKPRVKINPIELVGVTITYATAFHAKFVEENKLGPGAVIKIIRSGDVIPDIMEVIKPASNNKPKMPSVDYIWDKNHVNILIKNLEESEHLRIIKAKRMDYFFSTIGVKYISIGILQKLVDAGYDNIISILEADHEELAKIEGLGKKLIVKIFKNIDEIMKNTKLEKIMAGSHVFGTGIGEKKIKLILRKLPNVLKIKDKAELKKKILNIEGFSDISADKFVDNINKFKTFYDELRKIYEIEYLEESDESTESETKKIFTDNKIVFTGFRDNNLQEKIEKLGGTVNTSVSSKTNLVVHADDEKTSSKLKKAEELNIEIISKSNFIKKFNL